MVSRGLLGAGGNTPRGSNANTPRAGPNKNVPLSAQMSMKSSSSFGKMLSLGHEMKRKHTNQSESRSKDSLSRKNSPMVPNKEFKFNLPQESESGLPQEKKRKRVGII